LTCNKVIMAGCAPKCCVGKSFFGLVIAIVGFMFYFIGAGMIWNELIEQTDDNYLYEGTFNSANYIVTAWLFPMLIPFFVLILIKGKWFYSWPAVWLAAFVYVGLGFGAIFSIGHQEPPATGRYDWVSHSAPSVNAVRIAWEEGGRSCVGEEPAKQNCLDAKYRFNSKGFERSANLKSLGLSNFYMVNQDGGDGEREDVQIGVAGIVIIMIVGWSSYVALGGYSMSKGGYPMMPFAGSTNAETSQVTADGWTKSFANNTFLSMVGLGFALVSTFVLWTSDAAADPTHPFYETVLGMAISTFMVSQAIFLGVTMEENIFLEMGLFILGLTVFNAPTRMWQIAALAETDVVSDSVGGRAEYSQDVAAEAEIDRYYIGGVLGIISAVIAMIVGSKALAATQTDTDESLPATNSIFALFIKFGTLASFVGIFTGFGMLLKFSEDILGEIDATNSDRGNAANYFLFTVLFAYFGFLINTSAISAAPGAAEMLAPFKSLSYVSMGLCTAMFTGFNNIGTHDRQLWMVDLSMGGVNELRALLAHGSVDSFQGGRAYGVTEEQYQSVLAAIVIIFISMSIIFTATINMPFAYTGSEDANKQFANIKSKIGKVSIIFAILGAVCWIVGFVSLMSLDLAAPPVHKAPGTRGMDVSACHGKTFNMHALDSCDADEFAVNPEGERYTLNLLNSGDYTEAAVARYTEIFTFSAITMIAFMASLQGTLGGSLKTIKVGLFISCFGFLGLNFALSWVSSENYADQLSGEATGDLLCRRGTGDSDDEEECRTFKNGFVFFWLQSICVMISGVTAIASAWWANDQYGEKPASKGESGGAAKKSGFCGSCCSCCKPSTAGYTADATEGAAAEGKTNSMTNV